ncbi:MAG: galactose-1-phosphate uridylyltransferase [Chthoniobacter sp.]
MSEIRLNRLTGEWVVIAPERAKRGGNIPRPVAPIAVPTHDPTCPFCIGNEAMSGETLYSAPDEGGRWSVRAVMNKFSALSPHGGVNCADGPRELGETVNGVGLHEVVVETPHHHLSLAQLPEGQTQRVIEAYLQRFRDCYADPRVRHVIIFKNHGLDAGASQQHSHSQVVGIPIVPGQVHDRLEGAARFFSETGQCLACTMIAQELEASTRIVAENAHFIAFIPYAALSPFHLWIFPKAHAACFSSLPAAAVRDLAEIVHTVLAKVYGLLANPPFNLVVRSLGPQEADAPHFHWYIPIVPRVIRTAGFELGTGMYINPSLPEASAKALREYPV